MKIDTAVLLINDGNVLIKKRKSEYRFVYENKWEFPGGKVEEGETPEECLKKKIKEMLNIDVTIGECAGESIYVYEFIPFRLLAYRVLLDGENKDFKLKEDYKWVTQAEIGDYDFIQAYIPFLDKIWIKRSQ